MGPLSIRDLAVAGIAGAVLFALERALFPLAMLVAGPLAGALAGACGPCTPLAMVHPVLVHFSLLAVPLGVLLAVGYERAPMPSIVVAMGAVFALLHLLITGLWVAILCLWLGPLLAAAALGLWGRRGTPVGSTGLAAAGGLFVFGTAFPLALVWLAASRHLAGSSLAFAILSGVVPAILGALGGLLGARLSSQFRRAGLMP